MWRVSALVRSADFDQIRLIYCYFWASFFAPINSCPQLTLSRLLLIMFCVRPALIMYRTPTIFAARPGQFYCDSSAQSYPSDANGLSSGSLASMRTQLYNTTASYPSNHIPRIQPRLRRETEVFFRTKLYNTTTFLRSTIRCKPATLMSTFAPPRGAR